MPPAAAGGGYEHDEGEQPRSFRWRAVRAAPPEAREHSLLHSHVGVSFLQRVLALGLSRALDLSIAPSADWAQAGVDVRRGDAA